MAVLLLVFPAELFNSTYDKHHDKVEALLARLLPWRRKPRPAADLVLAERDTVAAAMESGQEVAAEPAEPAVVPDQPVLAASAGFASSGNAKYAACAVAGAVIGGFLDPGFGFSWASFTLVAGVLVTIVVGTVIGSMPGVLLRRRLGLPATAVLEAVPTGLVVAVVCVVVSRLVGFQPGYLYGLVGGLAFVVALTKLQQARAVFAGTLVALGVALAAWLAYVPLTSAATQPDPGFAVTISQAVAAALFVGGIEGTLIGLTPLKLLPGYTIWSWSRPAWFGLAIVTAFLFVTVLLRPENGYLGSSSTASVWVTYGLFAGFGMLSAAFWWWFEHGPGSEPDDPAPEVQRGWVSSLLAEQAAQEILDVQAAGSSASTAEEAAQQVTQSAGRPGVGRSVRGGSALHLLGQEGHHDRCEHGHQLAHVHSADATELRRVTELAGNLVTVVPEHMAEDLLTVRHVDLVEIHPAFDQRRVVLGQSLAQRLGAGLILGVGVEAADKRRERALHRGLGGVGVDAELSRDLLDREIVQDVVKASHGSRSLRVVLGCLGCHEVTEP